MFCTKCGVELRADDCFCNRCGQQTGVGRTVASGRPLMLDKRNKKIAGVCAGFARYMDIDVVLVRVIWLAIALGTGIGFIAYFAAWVIMPSDHGVEIQPAISPQPVAS